MSVNIAIYLLHENEIDNNITGHVYLRALFDFNL